MKTEFSDSTLGIMRLFNNEEYYKYSVEVFSSLNASALKCGIEYIDEKDGEYSLEEIVAEFGNPSGNHSPDYLDILRQLIDNGDVPMYIS